MRRGQKTNTGFLGWESSSPPPGVDEVHVGRAPHESSGAPEPARRANGAGTLKQEEPQTPRAPAAGERRWSPQLLRLLSPGTGEQLVPGRALSTAVLSGAHVEPQHLQRHVARAPSAQPPAASKQRRAKHDKLFMTELFAVQRVHQRL